MVRVKQGNAFHQPAEGSLAGMIFPMHVRRNATGYGNGRIPRRYGYVQMLWDKELIQFAQGNSALNLDPFFIGIESEYAVKSGQANADTMIIETGPDIR